MSGRTECSLCGSERSSHPRCPLQDDVAVELDVVVDNNRRKRVEHILEKRPRYCQALL